VTSPSPAPIHGPLDLNQNGFWERPPAERYAAYAQLRAMPQPPFFEAPESPFGTPERGYYALVRLADVAEASRNPEVFSSAAGATSLTPGMPGCAGSSPGPLLRR
jgi:methyl-branched lipid omega-hydroxylase